MTYLLDTNVISEVRKRERCDPHVYGWWGRVRDSELHLSVLVVGEIRKGIETVRGKDPRQAEALETWLEAVHQAFEGRLLDVDVAVAEEWGRMNARRSLPILDGLMAATAKVHGLTLVTRNVADVAGSGARLLNPFDAQTGSTGGSPT